MNYESALPQEIRTWAMFCHLASFSTYIGIPLGTILGPLIIWAIKKNDHPFIDEQGKESMNFQISYLIYSVGVLIVAIPVGLMTCGIGFVVFIPILLAIAIAHIVFTIIGAVRANAGEYYRYPYIIRMIT